MSCGTCHLSKYPDPENPAGLGLELGLTLPWIQTGQTDWSNKHRDELRRWCELSVKFMELIWRLSHLTSKVLFQWHNNTKVKRLFALSAEHDRSPSQAHSRHLALQLEKNARLGYVKSLSYFTESLVQMCEQWRGFIEGRLSKGGNMWTFALYTVSEERRPQVFRDLENNVFISSFTSSHH